MAGGRWYFIKEQLENSPSRKCGIDADKELSYRQQAANFIQDMGQRLQVTQLCINTAIVYMHRFYLFHSFSKFHRNAISTCSLFLAAKVEEQPRKLEHVIKIAHVCLHRENVPFDIKSDSYLEQSHELIANENVMLQTLGFDVGVDHPHTYVVKCCQLVRASKDLAQTSYIMATNSLHLTTMSLQYPPTVVACVCIHLACKWSNWELPTSSEGKEWYWYVDQTVTKQLLEELTSEFLAILEKCPSRLKRKLSGGKETESRDKRTKLEVPLPSPSSSVRSHEKELQPCEKRMKSEVPVSLSSSAVPNNEKAHTRQEDKRQVATASRRLKNVPSPAASKEIPSHHSKSSTTQNIPVSSLLKLPVSATQQPSPSKRSKEGSHSISIADYKEMKEKQEQKVKGHGKTSNYNPSQSHSVPLNSKKSGKEEKLDYLQNPKDRDRSNHHKVVHPKHAENNLLVNCEQQPTELPKEENLQQKIVDDARQISGNRVVNSNRVEPAVTGAWYEKVKPESSLSKHKELTTEMPVNPLSHQGKSSARSLTVTQGTQRSHCPDQDMRLRHGSDVHSEQFQTNTGNGEPPSQIKVNKTKHQKHRIVPAVIPKSLPQDDLPGHDRNARRILDESENMDNLKTDVIPVSHKSESDHSKRIDASFDKVGELHSRQERREKHKHKHSSHSSDREKTSVNTDQVSSASLSSSSTGGLKITIPKEKLCVSSTQRTNSSNSARDALKIKIDKRKIANNDSSNPIKIVIAKNKKQRNTYSCTSFAYSPQKSDCEGRKHEKSPGDACHGASTEHLNVSRSPKAKHEHGLPTRRSNSTHPSNDESQIPLPPEISAVQHINAISDSQQIATGSLPMNYQARPTHQGYVAYNQPQYFPPYYHQYPVHLNANTVRHQPLYNNPRFPPFLPEEPPLPTEPPPPPPPLPPE